MKSTTIKEAKTWLEAIEPFRELIPFNRIQDHEVQTLAILLAMQQEEWLVKAIRENIQDDM